MAHERSVTEYVSGDRGPAANYYGPGTLNEGQQLPGTPIYGSIQDAEIAARLRSLLEGLSPSGIGAATLPKQGQTMDQTGSIEQMIAQLLSGTGDPARPAGPPSPPPQTMWRTAPGMPSQPAPWRTGPRMMGAGTAPPPQPMPQQPMPPQQPAMPTQPALPTQAPGGQMNLEMLLQLLMQLFAPRGPGVAESRRSEP